MNYLSPGLCGVPAVSAVSEKGRGGPHYTLEPEAHDERGFRSWRQGQGWVGLTGLSFIQILSSAPHLLCDLRIVA